MNNEVVEQAEFRLYQWDKLSLDNNIPKEVAYLLAAQFYSDMSKLEMGSREGRRSYLQYGMKSLYIEKAIKELKRTDTRGDFERKAIYDPSSGVIYFHLKEFYLDYYYENGQVSFHLVPTHEIRYRPTWKVFTPDEILKKRDWSFPLEDSVILYPIPSVVVENEVKIDSVKWSGLKNSRDIPVSYTHLTLPTNREV